MANKTPGGTWSAQTPLCRKCGENATCKIWNGYFGWAYYCDACKKEQTMEDK